MKKRLLSTQNLLLFILLLIPFAIASATVFLGHVTLWYDPARDLLSAWDNLSKPTLLGPTSGIPGIFYGPYWIWLLSIGLLVSKDPLVVTYITATLPYFILFPILYFQLRKIFDKTSLLCTILLFLLGAGMQYSTQLWNPFPAPLLTLAVVVLILTNTFISLNVKTLVTLFLIGLLFGLIVNFHISFGIGLLFGMFLFFIIDTMLAYKSAEKSLQKKVIYIRILSLPIILAGLLFAFLPTLLFEFRHGFHQIETLLNTLTHYGAVVAVKGLSAPEIAFEFVKTFGKVLHVPSLAAGMVLLLLIILILFDYKKLGKKTSYESRRAMLLILSLFVGIAIIYFTARNPVWSYHFIGVDLFFILLIAYLSTQLLWVRRILIVWTAIIVVYSIVTSFQSLNKTPTLLVQQKAVHKIVADANGKEYTTYAYSPSIYMYEYAYLFRWLTTKTLPYDPGQVQVVGEAIYLIIPSKVDAKVHDFVNFRAPQNKYETEIIWKMHKDVVVRKEVLRKK